MGIKRLRNKKEVRVVKRGLEKKIKEVLDFPGGTVDKNPPANAEDMGGIPDPGRFHMPCATTTEAHTF